MAKSQILGGFKFGLGIWILILWNSKFDFVEKKIQAPVFRSRTFVLLPKPPLCALAGLVKMIRPGAWRKKLKNSLVFLIFLLTNRDFLAIIRV